ncbi:NADPH-dependent ferric siderophore reductase [Pedobacter sp. UYP30]|uniref:siderophore-interacting protein n=1 Tax=Pedobacter sp. UYP30 TaxID=1756400 RepID=UPI003395E15D
MGILPKKAVRSSFIIKEKFHLSPHYIRIIFDMCDEQLALFKNVKIGGNNKIFLPIEGQNHTIFPGELSTEETLSTTRRTYTTRHIDWVNKEMWIDFISHGDNGPASYWVNRADVGSKLSVAMKESSKPLFPVAQEYFFIGDSTALPLIGAMLEQLPKKVNVSCMIEIFGKEDELKLFSKANLKVQWIYNDHPELGSCLAQKVGEKTLLAGERFVYAAGEYSTAKKLREYFKDELGWSKDEYTIVSYWKRGESEDQSVLQRQEERKIN